MCAANWTELLLLSWTVSPQQEEAGLAKEDGEAYMEETAGLREGIMLIVGFLPHFTPPPTTTTTTPHPPPPPPNSDCCCIHVFHSFASGSAMHLRIVYLTGCLFFFSCLFLLPLPLFFFFFSFFIFSSLYCTATLTLICWGIGLDLSEMGRVSGFISEVYLHEEE